MLRTAVRERWRAARETLHRQGLLVLLWRILAKSLSLIGEPRLLTLCEMDLTRPLREPRARIDVEIGQATEAGVDALLEVTLPRHPSVHPRERLKLLDRLLSNFRRGGLCFVARVGGELAHVNWIHFQKGGSVMVCPGWFL